MGPCQHLGEIDFFEKNVDELPQKQTPELRGKGLYVNQSKGGEEEGLAKLSITEAIYPLLNLL